MGSRTLRASRTRFDPFWQRLSRPTHSQLYSTALPGDLAVFLTFTDPARRGNEDHAGAFTEHSAHLIAADAARVRGRVNPDDKLLAVIGVLAAIGAVFPA